MKRRDYSVEWSSGRATLHAPDCQLVRALAAGGEPVLTLLGCKRPPPATPHSCLEPSVRGGAGAATLRR